MRADFLPICFAIHILLAIFTSYAVAVSLDHLPAFLAFISDAGVLVPERSVFSFLINGAVVWHAITVFVRYKHVRAEIKARWHDEGFKGRKMQPWNRSGLFLGFLVSFGLSLIANFQLHTQRTSRNSGPTKEEVVVQKIHWFGAFLTFIGGLLWMCIHSVISMALSVGTKKGQWRRRTALFRMLTTIAGIFVVIMGITAAICSALHEDHLGQLQWNDSAKSSDSHWRGKLSLMAIICEWISALLIVSFALSMVPEFRAIQVTGISVELHNSTTGGGHCGKSCRNDVEMQEINPRTSMAQNGKSSPLLSQPNHQAELEEQF